MDAEAKKKELRPLFHPTAIKVTITEPGTGNSRGHFYMDAGQQGAGQGNLGGKDFNFFEEDLNPDFYMDSVHEAERLWQERELQRRAWMQEYWEIVGENLRGPKF